MLDKETFVNSINQYDNSYQKFSNNHIPTYKEYYVESSDDAEFYSYYLARIYHLPQLTKCYGCNGKKEVLREYKNYKGKKAGFIVDLDYLPFDRRQYEKLIVTTGYSMENFFFYNDSKNYNFEKIFKFFYGPNNYKRKVNEYLKQLNDFKEKCLLYYAFFKTCMEFSNKYVQLNNHMRIKDLVINESDNIEQLIDEEIDHLDKSIQIKFKERYEENKTEISSSGYMMIRGHDIFDHLTNYLKNDILYVKSSKIRRLAYDMQIPSEFEEQFFYREEEM